MGAIPTSETEAALMASQNKKAKEVKDDGERNREHSTDPGRKERDSH
jgi:hypothetical protein